jgi:hypothetical protein
MNKNSMKKGFIAFTSLLAISGVTFMIALSVTFMSISSVNSSLGYHKGEEALYAGKSCLEETLYQLRDDGNFSGVSLSVGSGSCIATVSALGNMRTIVSTGKVFDPQTYTRMVQGIATRIGKSIALNSWTEVSSTVPTPTGTVTPTSTPTNTPTPTITGTPTSTPTNTPTPTPTPSNCNQYCQQQYVLPGSCIKSNQCTGTNAGVIYECGPPNICCCQ